MSFNAASYLAANPDLIVAGITTATAEQHYISSGQREGRSTSFAAAAYIASNADLRRTFGTNTEAATQHYLTSGYAEGRQISFDGLRYLASNADLINAGIRTSEAAALHYIANGVNEGRTATSFSAGAYAISNADVAAALGTGDTASSRTALTQHFIDYGEREGRSLTPSSWSGTGTLGAARTSYDERNITLPTGRFRLDMMGADSGHGTLANPYLDLGREIFGERLTFRTDSNTGVGVDASIDFTTSGTATYSVRFGQESTSAGGSYTFAITQLS